jgi:hypothetical protein
LAPASRRRLSLRDESIPTRAAKWPEEPIRCLACPSDTRGQKPGAPKPACHKWCLLPPFFGGGIVANCRFRFGIRSLLNLTLVVALYCSAVSVRGGDSRAFLLLVATLLALRLLVIRHDKIAWTGFLCGAVLGLVGWLAADYVEPFDDQDRVFYLTDYTALIAVTGLLIGFCSGKIRRFSHAHRASDRPTRTLGVEENSNTSAADSEVGTKAN